MSMAQNVASTCLCARYGNVCDGDMTHHKVVACAVSCVATAQLGQRHLLARAQDQDA